MHIYFLFSSREFFIACNTHKNIASSNMSNLESFHDPSYSTLSRRVRSKKPKVHVPRLNRRWKLLKEAKEMAREGKLKREMKAKNMKLYMLNKIIVEENENLRRKATILLQENKILRSQFQKLPYPDSNTIRH